MVLNYENTFYKNLKFFIGSQMLLRKFYTKKFGVILFVNASESQGYSVYRSGTKQMDVLQLLEFIVREWINQRHP